jgi:CHAT domain-containing protein/tetratricopeptide (TPR) repeat protein
VRGRDQHLSRQEIQELATLSGDSLTGSLEEAMHHVGQCDECRLRMLLSDELGLPSFSKAQSELPARTPACPPDSAWLEVAAGLASAEDSWRRIQHASACKRCGQLLRMAAEDLAVELTSDEEEKVAALASASPKWQRSLAERLASGGLVKSQVKRQEAGRRNLHLRPRWIFATAALAVIACVGLLGWSRTRPQYANELLAQAYSEQRTLELRIPGARYGRMGVERGASRELPEYFFVAEGIIKPALSQHPDDPKWLQAQARADLLAWKYEAAIENLKHGLDLDPSALSLKSDLASAYFERAEDANRPIDYQNAMELLGQVLAKSPDDPTALFNRAIVYDRMFMYHDAIADWKHYLQVDPQGPWAGEAHRLLKETIKKQEEHDKKSSGLLLEPRAINERIDVADEATWSVADERIEDYLEAAIINWLPEAFPSAGQRNTLKEKDAREAVGRLALVLQKHHSDAWLADMKATKPETYLPLALANLAAAVRDNEAGKADAARAEANKAANLFQQNGNRAGYVRSRLEVAYALHRSSQGEGCLEVIGSLLPEASRSHYAWIESQALLEESVCSHMANDLERAETSLEKATVSSQKRSYLSLYLRAVGFLANEKWTVKGDHVGAWAQDRAGLSNYWKGSFPWLRAYNFYQDLAASAELSGFKETAFSLRKEAVSIDAKMDDDTRHAIAHFLLAKTAAAAGKTIESQSEFSIAQSAFGRLPDSNANKGYRLYSEIQLAQLEGDQGSFAQGLARLSHVQGELPSLRNSPTELAFYQAMGALNQKRGANHEAEVAFRSAIDRARAGFASVRSKSDRLAMLKTVGRTYRGLVELKLADHNPQEALEIWEEYRGWSSSAPSEPSQSVASSMAAAKSPRNETTITYAVLDNGISIWTSDERGPSWAFVKIPPQELEQAVRRFTEQCSSQKSDIQALRHNAERLYRWLVYPIEAHLHKGSTLVTEPDSVLNQVPMEALVNGNGEYLADSFVIVYSSGRQQYQNLRRYESITQKSSVLIVNPVLANGASRGLLPIPDSRREVEIVRSSFSQSELLDGNDATWSTLQKELPSAAFFHFVGHGFAMGDRSNLMLTSATVNPFDSVGSSRLSSLDMHSLRLAVLSACSTGVVDDDGIAGLNSLVGVFLQANVPHVIAARWDVDSATTVEFMRPLYAALHGDAPPPRAVALARLKIRTDPATAHPYFWAGYAAFGRA